MINLLVALFTLSSVLILLYMMIRDFCKDRKSVDLHLNNSDLDAKKYGFEPHLAYNKYVDKIVAPDENAVNNTKKLLLIGITIGLKWRDQQKEKEGNDETAI